MSKSFLRKIGLSLTYHAALFSRASMAIVTVMFGALFAIIMGGSPLVGAVSGAGVFGLAYTFRHSMPRGVAMAGVYVEVWIGELIKQFNQWTQATFLEGVTNYSQYAKNNVIHLVDVGANPDCLLNNTAYPIAIQNLDDGDVAISLDKLQTKATRITDDELYAISYDKIALKRSQHGDSLMNMKYDKAIHAIAPPGHTADTPIMLTTGEDDGTGRKRLTIKDLVNYKTLLDKRKFPVKGRRLVLCPDHVNDLLTLDQKFEAQYGSYEEGKVGRVKGFDIYEYVNCPYFKLSDKTKLAFGGVPVDGTHNQASVFFLPGELFTADGDTKMYSSDAANSPLTQESLINFRTYTITLPKKQRCIGAIVSAKVA